MIQAAQVASKFTLFTHHAKTFPDLVTALRNSMLRTGVFKNEKTAEEQVVQVLNFDIHLVKDFKGKRYVERITECIPVENKNEYTFNHKKEKTLEGKFDSFFDNATHFFTKITDKQLFIYKNILEYVDGEYLVTNPITANNIKEMKINMEDTDAQNFDRFIENHWGSGLIYNSEAEKNAKKGIRISKVNKNVKNDGVIDTQAIKKNEEPIINAQIIKPNEDEKQKVKEESERIAREIQEMRIGTSQIDEEDIQMNNSEPFKNNNVQEQRETNETIGFESSINNNQTINRQTNNNQIISRQINNNQPNNNRLNNTKQEDFNSQNQNSNNDSINHNINDDDYKPTDDDFGPGFKPW